MLVTEVANTFCVPVIEIEYGANGWREIGRWDDQIAIFHACRARIEEIEATGAELPLRLGCAPLGLNGHYPAVYLSRPPDEISDAHDGIFEHRQILAVPVCAVQLQQVGGTQRDGQGIVDLMRHLPQQKHSLFPRSQRLQRLLFAKVEVAFEGETRAICAECLPTTFGMQTMPVLGAMDEFPLPKADIVKFPLDVSERRGKLCLQ